MENELSCVVDALPGLVWTALPDGHIDCLNQRWCQYTDLSADEASGRGWQTAIHPEDLPELRERWRSMLASGAPRAMEARLRRFDGAYHWFQYLHMVARWTRDQHGQLEYSETPWKGSLA